MELPQDLWELIRGEPAGVIEGIEAAYDGSETARARLLAKYGRKADMSKKDVDPESVFNPLIPGVSDEDVIKAGQARDYLEKYGPKLDPKKAPDPDPDIKDNPFIPGGE